MAQLKMRWRAQPVKEIPVPKGCTMKKFDRPEEIDIWLDICKNGLIEPDAGQEEFESNIRNHPDLCPEHDLIFVLCDGEYAATIAAIYHPETESGYIHMVAAKPEFRGRGIGNWMNYLALSQITREHPETRYCQLITESWRKAAVRSYLRAGFEPMDCAPDIEECWQALINELEIPQVQLLNENCEPVKTMTMQK